MMKKTFQLMTLCAACLALMMTTACESNDPHSPKNFLKSNLCNDGWMVTDYSFTADGMTTSTPLFGDVTKDGEIYPLNALLYFYEDETLKLFTLMEDNKWALMYTGIYSIDDDGDMLTLRYNESDYVPVWDVKSYTSTKMVVQDMMDTEVHTVTFTRVNKDLALLDPTVKNLYGTWQATSGTFVIDGVTSTMTFTGTYDNAAKDAYENTLVFDGEGTCDVYKFGENGALYKTKETTYSVDGDYLTLTGKDDSSTETYTATLYGKTLYLFKKTNSRNYQRVAYKRIN